MLGQWLKHKTPANGAAGVPSPAPKAQENIPASFEAQLEEAVAASRSTSPDRVRLQLQLAATQRQHANRDPAKLQEAEATIRAALEVAAVTSDSVGYLECLDALSQIYHDRGDFPHMQGLLEEGVRLEASLPHPNQARMARRMHNLGLARHLLGEDATAVLEKAVKLHEQAFGQEHVETANALANLGILHGAMGRHEEARARLERALQIHGRELAYTSPEALRDFHNLACTLAEAGDIPGAVAVYDRALELLDRLIGADQEKLAELQFFVATLYVTWEHYAGARELLAMCLGTFRRKKGARLAVAYELSGHIEEISGRYPGAVAELEKAGKIWESCGAEKLEELANNLEYRADLLDELKKKDSANWLREKAVKARAGEII